MENAFTSFFFPFDLAAVCHKDHMRAAEGHTVAVQGVHKSLFTIEHIYYKSKLIDKSVKM